MQPDWLLIYRIDADVLVLILSRTGASGVSIAVDIVYSRSLYGFGKYCKAVLKQDKDNRSNRIKGWSNLVESQL